MTDPYKKVEEALPGAPMSYKTRHSHKGAYAPERDILGFYGSLQRAVIEVVAERHPDKTEDITKLEQQANGFINEATTGEKKLSMAQFVEMHDLVMNDIDKDIIDEYTRLMCAAFMFRFVLAKRERPEATIELEELGRSFQGLYVLSVLPPELSKKVETHLRAFNHVRSVLFDNEPPAVVDEEAPESG